MKPSISAAKTKTYVSSENPKRRVGFTLCKGIKMHLQRFFVQAQDALTSFWKTRIREIKSKKMTLIFRGFAWIINCEQISTNYPRQLVFELMHDTLYLNN